MGLLLLVAGLGLLVLPGAAAPLGRRLAPAEWARLCQTALAAGAVIVELAFVAYALPTALRSAGVPTWATMCERMLRTFVPGGAPAGWLAATAASCIAVFAAVGAIRARRGCAAARVESWLGEHHRYAGHDLVTLASDQLIAVSVAGVPGQIVVSTGLVEALPAERLELVLAHEAAHLDLGHEHWLRLAAAADAGFAFFWPVRRSTSALRLALERCADEVAAGDHPDQRALLRSALLDVAALAVGAELAAFSAADTVIYRVEALAQSRPEPSTGLRAMLYAPGLSLGGLVLTALAAWGGEAHMMISMAGRCA